MVPMGCTPPLSTLKCVAMLCDERPSHISTLPYIAVALPSTMRPTCSQKRQIPSPAHVRASGSHGARRRSRAVLLHERRSSRSPVHPLEHSQLHWEARRSWICGARSRRFLATTSHCRCSTWHFCYKGPSRLDSSATSCCSVLLTII